MATSIACGKSDFKQVEGGKSGGRAPCGERLIPPLRIAARNAREEDPQDFETALRVAISRTDHLVGFMRSFAGVIRLPNPDPRPTKLKPLLEHTALLLKPECDPLWKAMKKITPPILAPIMLNVQILQIYSPCQPLDHCYVVQTLTKHEFSPLAYLISHSNSFAVARVFSSMIEDLISSSTRSSRIKLRS
ncbi:MAG: hypothetical protein L0387_32805 [Acidobacteria bacterium]|nr:hypothetical protein [Acidobacteriota bacterium]MCI0626373.1 hypothetical protein [Acidobacteriota bacterium]MCI0720704.1 hypothetical protein [Acidobacteriota bacterium]